MPNRWDPPEVNIVKKLLQKGLPEKVRELIDDTLFAEYVSKNEGAFSRELYMDEDQVKCLMRHGMFIGSHGWNHSWLNSISSAEQEAEIMKSVQFLDRLGCGATDWVFCYPYGAYNESLLDVLTRHKCKIAVTVESRAALPGDNLLTLPRLDTNDLPKDRDFQGDKMNSV